MINSNRVAMPCYTHEQWQSAHTPTDAQPHARPDYNYNQLWSMAKYYFGVELPKTGKLVIDFESGVISSFEMQQEPVKKVRKTRKRKATE